jgi:hypothetical protein
MGMTGEFTDEDFEIISSAFGREMDYCIRGSDREKAVEKLYEMMRDIMTKADLP